MIGEVFTEHWHTILTSTQTKIEAIIKKLFPPVISIDTNQMRALPPSDLEIEQVIKYLNPYKAPDRDGFKGEFFKTSWSTIGPARPFEPLKGIRNRFHGFF